MPIDYKEYPSDWKEISERIRRERAHHKCEWCGVKNGAIIVRLNGDKWRYITDDEFGMLRQMHKHFGLSWSEAVKRSGYTRIILTVAHLNHIKHDVRDENLRALCQRCHLQYDLPRHIYNRKYGRKARENNLSLEL